VDEAASSEPTGIERETPAPDDRQAPEPFAAFIDTSPTQPMLPTLPPAAMADVEPLADAEPSPRDAPESLALGRVESMRPGEIRTEPVRPRRSGARPSRPPSTLLVVAVLLLGILVGLLLGIAGSSLFGGWPG
jgi:hypothetical protein